MIPRTKNNAKKQTKNKVTRQTFQVVVFCCVNRFNFAFITCELTNNNVEILLVGNPKENKNLTHIYILFHFYEK
jgi:hypothetical protein